MPTFWNNHMDTQVVQSQEEYFYSMLSGPALEIASPYLREERNVIGKLLGSSDEALDTFVGVGVGPLLYSDIVWQYNKNYIAVDPLLEQHLGDEDIENLVCHAQSLSDLSLQRGSSNYLFAFVFNLIAYLSDVHSLLNQHLRKGDVVMFSTWADTEEAFALQEKYVNNLVLSSDEKLNAEKKRNFKLEEFDPRGLNHYVSHCYYQQTYSNTLVIRLV